MHIWCVLFSIQQLQVSVLTCWRACNCSSGLLVCTAMLVQVAAACWLPLSTIRPISSSMLLLSMLRNTTCTSCKHCHWSLWFTFKCCDQVLNMTCKLSSAAFCLLASGQRATVTSNWDFTNFGERDAVRKAGQLSILSCKDKGPLVMSDHAADMQLQIYS